MSKKIEDCLPEDSWFRTWLNLWPVCESPRSWILFTGMTMMGAALGRSVWLDQDVHILFPMLNLLLIGPSGTGKSTSAGLGFELITTSLPVSVQPQIVSGAPTPEKLHDDLRVKPHAVLFASELANFFNKQKYMEGLIPYVTELLDYGKYVERRTKTSGIVRIDRPAVTVLGCSTKEWLQEQLPDSATSGGFLARFFIVNEEHKSQNVALPKQALTAKQRLRLEIERAKAFDRFSKLVAAREGEIDFYDYEAQDVYTEWYSTHQPINGHLSPFHARAGEFVLRLAMLSAISSDRGKITAEDVRAAITLQRYSENKLEEVVVPMTPQGKLLSKALESISAGGTSDIAVRRAMKNYCSAQDTDKLIESLIRSGDVQRTSSHTLVRTSQ